MSDPENFLTRWSRRKAEVERTDAPREPVQPVEPAAAEPQPTSAVNEEELK
jgi:hypothetical protein